MDNFRFFNCGLNIILWSVFHVFKVPFIKLTYKIWKTVKTCFFFTYISFSIQPTVHNGRVSRRRVSGCGCWLIDRWQVAGDRWHVTCYKWQVTSEMWHMTHNMWHMTHVTKHFYLPFKAIKGEKKAKLISFVFIKGRLQKGACMTSLPVLPGPSCGSS